MLLHSTSKLAPLGLMPVFWTIVSVTVLRSLRYSSLVSLDNDVVMTLSKNFDNLVHYRNPRKRLLYSTVVTNTFLFSIF